MSQTLKREIDSRSLMLIVGKKGAVARIDWRVSSISRLNNRTCKTIQGSTRNRSICLR